MRSEIEHEAGGFESSRLFPSFFGGGFECSTFRRRSGYRVDMVEATRHEQFARQDYERMQEMGLRTAREGVRWHLVEKRPGKYDFSSVLPIVRAARVTGTQVIWDLCHFGWPDDLDLFQPEFVSRLAGYGAAFARWLAKETNASGFFVPVNEISFFSWAAGDEGSMDPFVTGRGFELKTQLVRAAIQTMKAIQAEDRAARFVHVDPMIHVVAHPRHPEEQKDAEAYRRSQFQSWDMLSGRASPELGGEEKFLDIVGVNYYPHNQWFYDLKDGRRARKFKAVSRRNKLYRPFRDMLAEVWRRYGRPICIAETGAEDRRRGSWFRYVCEETEAAIQDGIPIQGLCLYPILNHPGWIDDRHCHNALWDYPDDEGHREIYTPLAKAIRQWQFRFDSLSTEERERGSKNSTGTREPRTKHSAQTLQPESSERVA